MSRRNLLSILCLIFLANNFVNYTLCAYLDYYKEYSLESEKFCNILGQTRTTNIENTSIIVRSKHIFDRWIEGRKNIHCKFVVKAAKEDGLFGVIQKISFRRNGTQCLDYVQFRRKDHHRSEKFCDSFDRSKVKYYVVPEDEDSVYSLESTSIMRTYAEFDPSSYKSGSELETEIFVSKEKLREGEFLTLSIAYTPFKNCSKVDLQEYTQTDHSICLLNKYFCDGTYNCAPGVCSDEDNCPNNPNEIISTGTGTKITIGAVTTVILCFIIFVMCLWICKKSQKLYWYVEYADTTRGTMPGTVPLETERSGNHTTRGIMPGTVPLETERSGNHTIPSAPILEIAVPSTVTDKDLPPSYDSLFPEQSNPVRS